jgi:four helix bundle protein
LWQVIAAPSREGGDDSAHKEVEMPHTHTPAAAHEPPALELDRLDVYRVALEFQRLAAAATTRVRGELRSQLERASLSVPLNVAEGFGRRSAADRRHFYSIARGSALECAALLDILASRGLIAIGFLRQLRSLLVRIIQMLTKLGQR